VITYPKGHDQGEQVKRLLLLAAVCGSFFYSLGAVSTASADPMPHTYTVASGDTLWSIGIRFLHRLDAWQAIASLNRVPNPNLIYVGQVITIPSDTQPASAPPPTPVPKPKPQVTYTPPAPVRAAASGGFQACVAWRESGNGQNPNVYGFLDSTWHSLGLSGSPSTASRAQQDAAFAQLYAKAGTVPWAPYDGC
jgi:LysM repeat protein